MASASGFRVQIDARLLGVAANAGTEKLVDATAEKVSGAMRDIAPVETTALSRSIGVETDGAGSDRVALIGPEAGFTFEGREPATYAIHVEKGTSVAPAQPFMEPALLQYAAV